MLKRQKTILALLSRAQKPLSPIVFVKMVFLLRHETELKNDPAFYDFVPYKYGPFSFALYQELAHLRRYGYVSSDEDHVSLGECTTELVEEKVEGLPASVQRAVDNVVTLYGEISQYALLKDVYSRFPWYATKSELTNFQPNNSAGVIKSKPAVYTAGYEGKSVDAFFNQLLKKRIQLIIDVRANPVSRRYGFSKRRCSEIAGRLGLEYLHMPDLGISSKYRGDLSDFGSYQRLLRKYEQEMLPELEEEIDEVGKLMKHSAAVLMCVEKNVRCCHRSRLAEAVSRKTGAEVVHI
ncbi:MAG: DUF488 family protein [bacterium]